MTSQPPSPGPHEIRPEDVRTGPPTPGAPPRGVRGLRAALRDDRLRTALLIAIVADVVQWLALPLFVAGAISPWNDVLDVGIAFVMIRLLGWHWSFVPTFAAKLIPIVDLAPTWTLAVLLASRRLPARKEPA
jgi:hypothetical protein